MKRCLAFSFRLLTLIIIPLSVFAQEPMNNFDYELERMVQIPNSPEVNEFMRYGDTSVNLYSGTADISIPLYTIQGSELSIPITQVQLQ